MNEEVKDYIYTAVCHEERLRREGGPKMTVGTITKGRIVGNSFVIDGTNKSVPLSETALARTSLVNIWEKI